MPISLSLSDPRRRCRATYYEYANSNTHTPGVKADFSNPPKAGKCLEKQAGNFPIIGKQGGAGASRGLSQSAGISPAAESHTSVWQTVMAATPTMSSALHPRDRSFTGFARPCMIGP